MYDDDTEEFETVACSKCGKTIEAHIYDSHPLCTTCFKPIYEERKSAHEEWRKEHRRCDKQ